MSDEFWQTVQTLAEELPIKKETTTKWKQRGNVPSKWRIPLFQLSQAKGLALRLDDFADTTTQ